MSQGDPPYDLPESEYGTSYWVRPIKKRDDERRKLFRKQILASLMLALSYVVRYRPRVIVGIGQGGLIASLLTRPLLVEQAARARVATALEMIDIRRAWVGVVSLIACNPVVSPQRTDYAELLSAVPEIHMIQPKGIL